MFRRFISMLVLAGYFAGQLAMVPHAHAASDADHENQPHFHGRWLTDWLNHGGRANADHSHHAHGGHDHSHGHSLPADSGSLPHSPPPEHSDDCILLPDFSNTAILQKDAKHSAAIGDVALPVECDLGPVKAARFSSVHHPQFNEWASGRHLYLTLRALRI
jgi:hypothetical protein